MLRKQRPDHGRMHSLHVVDLVRDLRSEVLHEPRAGELFQASGIVPWHHQDRGGYPYPDSGLVKKVIPMKMLWELPGGRPTNIKAVRTTARFARALAVDHGLTYQAEVNLRAITNIVISLGLRRASAEKMIGVLFDHRR